MLLHHFFMGNPVVQFLQHSGYCKYAIIAYLCKRGTFLHISAHFFTYHGTQRWHSTHTISGNQYWSLLLCTMHTETPKMCIFPKFAIFVKNLLFFCIFLLISAHTMAQKGATIHPLYMATNIGHF